MVTEGRGGIPNISKMQESWSKGGQLLTNFDQPDKKNCHSIFHYFFTSSWSNCEIYKINEHV